MKHRFHNRVTLVLIALAALLTACGRSVRLAGVEVGVAPSTTPVPTETPIPTATPGPTSTPAPTETPTPTLTPTLATTKERPSEIHTWDETWNQYINYQMGFSIQIPRTMVSPNGSCKWVEENGDHSYRPKPSYVPVIVLEDGNTTYIAGESYHELAGVTQGPHPDGGTRTFFSECRAVTNSLALLRDPENRYQTKWEIVAAEVHNDDELDAFIKARYGSGCRLGEKAASGQEGVYDVGIRGDGKDLSETQCPINYATVVKYYPQGNKVVAWDLGQAPTFRADLAFQTTYDQKMVESFRFLTGTPAGEESPATR